MSSVHPSAGERRRSPRPMWRSRRACFPRSPVPPQVGQLRSEQTRERVSAAARRKGHDDAHRLRGKVLRNDASRKQNGTKHPVKFMRRSDPAAILALLCGASRANVVAPANPERGHEEQRNVWLERLVFAIGASATEISGVVTGRRVRKRAVWVIAKHRPSQPSSPKCGHRRARPLSDPRASAGRILQRLGAGLRPGRFEESKERCWQDPEPEGGWQRRARKRRGVLPGHVLVFAAQIPDKERVSRTATGKRRQAKT